jgi:TonB family protein
VTEPVTRVRRVVGAVVLAVLMGGCATVAPRCKVDRPPSERRVALDSPDRKYRDYFNKLWPRIRAKWIYPHPAGERGVEGKALIDFDIAKDGHLTYIALTSSSGTPILDDAALVAVKLAQPFPPVPDSVSRGELRVRGAFCYQIVKGS